MQPFRRLEAIAAPIDERNLDTNQLCPTHFNKVPRSDPGYVRILFHNQRFAADGAERGDFILNRHPYRDARILVADENFGCGSSRESAVYALWAFGIRCVIAPSFGDIFYSNCTKNGLLPVHLARATCNRLRQALRAQPGATIAVDLERQCVGAPDGSIHSFDILPSRKRALLEGLDDVAVTLEHREAIGAFEARYKPTLPWIYAGTGSTPADKPRDGA